MPELEQAPVLVLELEQAPVLVLELEPVPEPVPEPVLGQVPARARHRQQPRLLLIRKLRLIEFLSFSLTFLLINIPL